MKQQVIKQIGNFGKKEVVLIIFLLLLIVLSILFPSKIKNYPDFIDWKTIIALTGLLIVATGLKESGYFNVFARKTIKRISNERKLACFLVLFSLMLSAFLTNDITLFIVIPITLSIGEMIQTNISRFIIFEAIAVNAGSALTPIGNPQNIYLWHNWDIPFMAFLIKMLPLVILFLAVLFIFIRFAFPAKEFKLSNGSNNHKPLIKRLFTLSVTLMIVFIIALEYRIAYLVLPVVFVLYLVFYRRVLLKTDWLLLLLFMIIFIDFHVISEMNLISEGVNSLNLKPAGNVYLFSGLISQIISNVPAAVFVSKFSQNWHAISYGVNIGGSGLALSSLANIIALRMAKDKGIWLSFHKYSIPFFLISGGLTYVLFFY